MRRSKPLACVVAAALAGLTFTAGPARALLLDAAFAEKLITTVPTGVTSMAWAPDGSGRLFLTRRTGQILIVQDGALKETPFASLAPVYINVTETGLLGLDFDPDFSSNGFVYVFVTVSATEQQIIRYTADGDVGREPKVVVSGLPTRGRNHNGGGLAVGPDGKLYWGVGDNGNATGVNDDLASLAAKIGRAELDGAVPVDNPFVDGDGPNADFIWARGVRNPFTLAWQPQTEKLWVSVVGLRYEQVFVLGAAAHAGWSRYESTQPDDFVTPVISYPTSGPVPFTILATGAVRSGGVATFTTQAAHRLHPGVRVTVAGVTNASFNGSAVVTDVPSPTTFSFAQPGADATSGNGTASGPDIGACVTGGTFLDSTSVPDEYRGNYFFGDYVSGRIERARLDPNANSVVSVEHWAEGFEHAIDLAVGPDGDLYYVNFAGALYRARHNAIAQGIVVSRRNVRLAEGGRAALSVRLATEPAANVTVAASHADGDVDVTVDDAALVFTPQNWASPQPVRLTAREDGDAEDDHATLRFTAAGLPFAAVTARVTDNDLVPTGGAGGGDGTGGGAAGADALGGAGAVGVSGADGAGGALAAVGGGDQAAGEASTGEGGGQGAASQASEADSGCGCRTGAAAQGGVGTWLLALAAVVLARRRRVV